MNRDQLTALAEWLEAESRYIGLSDTATANFRVAARVVAAMAKLEGIGGRYWVLSQYDQSLMWNQGLDESCERYKTALESIEGAKL